MNYNDGTDYDNGQGNSGIAHSPEIALGGFLGATLTFACNYEVEAGASDASFTYGDHRTLKVFSSNLLFTVW